MQDRFVEEADVFSLFAELFTPTLKVCSRARFYASTTLMMSWINTGTVPHPKEMPLGCCPFF
jgi:hypothetical protein